MNICCIYTTHVRTYLCYSLLTVVEPDRGRGEAVTIPSIIYASGVFLYATTELAQRGSQVKTGRAEYTKTLAVYFFVACFYSLSYVYRSRTNERIENNRSTVE